MIPFPHTLPPVQAYVPATVLLLALLGISLVLIFAGRALAKVVAFLAVGVIGAAFGGQLAAQYLAPQWATLGLLLGFVLGGIIGLVLLPLGVGLALGYAAYVVALSFAPSWIVAFIAGVAFFVVGALLSDKILGVATALIGGLLLFDVLTRYAGLGSPVATLVAALLTVVGLWVQLAPSRHPSQPTTTPVGGQPSDRR